MAGERVFLNVGTRASMPNVPGLVDAVPMTHIDDRTHEIHDREAPMGSAMSFLPYVVLTAIAIVVLTIGPLESALGSIRRYAVPGG